MKVPEAMYRTVSTRASSAANGGDNEEDDEKEEQEDEGSDMDQNDKRKNITGRTTSPQQNNRSSSPRKRSSNSGHNDDKNTIHDSLSLKRKRDARERVADKKSTNCKSDALHNCSKHLESPSEDGTDDEWHFCGGSAKALDPTRSDSRNGTLDSGNSCELDAGLARGDSGNPECSDSGNLNATINALGMKKLKDATARQRIAREFGDSKVYFGAVEKCFASKEDVRNWTWHVVFDDADEYEFDVDEMLDALDTYRRCYEAEMSGPNRSRKVAKMVGSFNRQRKDMLAMLPDSYKSRFLQVGFAKWESSYHAHLKYYPVLFLGPFDVAQGPIRQQMCKEIEKAKSGGKNLSWLVYWYGEKLATAFSFLPQGKCLTYEEGVAGGLHKPPKLTQKKLDAGGKLTKAEEKLIAAQDQMKEDLSKRGAERIRFKKLKEDHESVVAGDRLMAEIEAQKEEDERTGLSDDEEEGGAAPDVGGPTHKAVGRVKSETTWDMEADYESDEDDEDYEEEFRNCVETSQESSSKLPG